MKDILGLILLPLTIPLIVIALIAVQVKVVVEIIKDWRKRNEKTRIV
jgi:hypothetical protein